MPLTKQELANVVSQSIIAKMSEAKPTAWVNSLAYQN